MLNLKTKSEVVILHKKCSYSEFFWSVFFSIGTECGAMLRIRIRKTPNTKTFYAVSHKNVLLQRCSNFIKNTLWYRYEWCWFLGSFRKLEPTWWFRLCLRLKVNKWPLCGCLQKRCSSNHTVNLRQNIHVKELYH